MHEPEAKSVLGEALEVSPGERAAWVEARCGSDVELRARVQALLDAHDRFPGVLGSPTLARPASAAAALAARGEYAEGDRVGPYRILRLAGRGGFGTVYLAEQREPVERRVALKVLDAGASSQAALARFDAERQALARMEHPAIARVYDAGTTDSGRPYFAMEFVDGRPITEHCREEALELADVLRLFRVVCQAVHHAHEKGVVHRDLKPSNVLVTTVDGQPFPKVIDFGIAKAIDSPLTAHSVLSVEGQLIGTPAYMSPEQAAGEMDVDTRTDVYALGVLLYELACGQTPFEAGSLGFAGLLRAIAENDPPPPSRRRAADPEASTIRSVPADLDWIALRCLEKDRARRYESAFALGRDVGRFLGGLPVEAAPPSVGYRLRKLAARHRVAAVAASLSLLALVGGSIGTGVGLVGARRANAQLQELIGELRDETERARLAEERAANQARRALEQSEVARAVNDFLTQDLLASAVPSAERGRGRDVLLREVLDVAAERLEAGDRFAGKPVVESAVRAMLGIVYGELGELEKALVHTRRAAELRAAALGPDAPLAMDSRSRLGGQLRLLERFDESEEVLVPLLERMRVELGPAARPTLLTAQRVGMLRRDQGRLEDAYELLRSSHELSVEHHGAESAVTLELLGALAIAAQQTGRYEEAERRFRRALDLRRAAHGDGNPDTLAATVNLATFLRATHRFDEAESLLHEVLEQHRGVLGDDHPATGTTLYNLAALELERGHAEEAEQLARRALAIFEAAFDDDNASVLRTLSLLARSLEGRADPAEVEALHRRAYEAALRSRGPDHPLTDSRRKDLAGFLYHHPGHAEEVRRLLEQSYETQRRRQGPTHPTTLTALENLSLLARRDGRTDEAEAMLLEALEGFRARLGSDHVETLKTESSLAGLYLDSGRPAEALERARHTVEAAEGSLEEDDYDLARFRLRLGLALEDLGRRGEAYEVFAETHAVLVRSRGEDDPLAAFAAGHMAVLEPED